MQTPAVVKERFDISINTEEELYDFCDKYGFTFTIKKSSRRKKVCAVLKANKEMRSSFRSRKMGDEIFPYLDINTERDSNFIMAYGVNLQDALQKLIEKLNTIQLVYWGTD